MRLFSLVVGGMATFGLMAGATVGPGQDADQALYSQQCAMCHGSGGAGDGPAAAAFNPKPSSFTDAEFQESRTDEQLTAGISDGKGTMPGYKDRLSAEQIKSLVSYIRKLGKPEAR
jgi:mono/diheme cytochrome c family protein